MKHRAFTMIELIFVIIVVGIIAAMAMPRIDRDIRQGAAQTILSNIRYTQHLALMDNKHRFDNRNWQKRYWKIMFGTCTGNDRFFMVGSDDDMDGGASGFFDINESAIDPTNGKPLFWTNGQDCSEGDTTKTVSPQVFISKRYGIKSFTFLRGCANVQYVGFDRLGRPHVGFSSAGNINPDYASYMTDDCIINFKFTDTSIEDLNITINKETGYAYVVGAEDNS
ncbi:MAG: prepilin-type N-terminal cleavage/methylation domain-containing protein [Sulfurovum sp.]|nr:prepilin-type N-terminal cleavage/methylation domain-containing protein [Sulfurovum sp.]